MMMQDIDQERMASDSRKKIKQVTDGEQKALALPNAEKAFLWSISQNTNMFCQAQCLQSP